MSRGHICFHSDYLYPVLVPSAAPFAGGAETQLAKLAHGLLERGFEVTVVTCDFGQPAEIVHEGVRILRSFNPRQGLPVARFFHPRLTRAAGALWKANAELYYVNGSGMAAGLAADVARLRGAGYVNHCASDYDVLPEQIARHMSIRDRWWYLRAIRMADELLAQTEWQQERFRAEFGLHSEILPNIATIPLRAADVARNRTVVWLGTYKQIKRPEWFTRLAADLPDVRFVMVGVIPPPPLSQQHWLRARSAAERTSNLDVRGFGDSDAIAGLLDNAAILVHTSPVEGFSNVLLEAWSKGVPTVSCVNPDAVVTREGLGAAVAEYSELKDRVQELLRDPEARRAIGARARAYVQRRHSPSVVLDRLARIADQVIAKIRQRRARN